MNICVRNSRQAIVKRLVYIFIITIESNLYIYCFFCIFIVSVYMVYLQGISYQFEINVINAFYNKF